MEEAIYDKQRDSRVRIPRRARRRKGARSPNQALATPSKVSLAQDASGDRPAASAEITGSSSVTFTKSAQAIKQTPSYLSLAREASRTRARVDGNPEASTSTRRKTKP
jgi:hypothetical protein